MGATFYGRRRRIEETAKARRREGKREEEFLIRRASFFLRGCSSRLRALRGLFNKKVQASPASHSVHRVMHRAKPVALNVCARRWITEMRVVDFLSSFAR